MLDSHVDLRDTRVLLLGAHTDDGEWACGASINKWAKLGADITYVAFSAAEESVRPEFPRDILRTEIMEGAARMGLHTSNVRVLDLPVRHFPEHRQAILEILVRLRSELEPDLVLVHCSQDTHQDHQTLSAETFRAFKRTSILGYELPHNCQTAELRYFNVISEENLNAKISALQAYKSQMWRSGDVRPFLEGLATVRGAQVGVKFAEAFEVIRWVDR